ncbi:MAG: hypothetical protein ABSB95_13850 [Dissulfurispiraceae bacterium]|jgi:hypothetical protein
MESDIQNQLRIASETIKAQAEAQERKRQEEEYSKRIDALTRVVSAAYDKSSNYTKLVIAIGYAAFFTVWEKTKYLLSDQQMLWAGLLITISCLFFILWEVIKMTVTGIHENRWYVSIAASPQDFDKVFSVATKNAQRLNIKFIRFWYVALAVILLSGLSGVGILLYSFISQIIKQAL